MLARILQRNAKRRQEFKPGPLSKVLIDGAQAYKATFTDVGLGVAGRGCVYILISGPYLVNMSIRQRIEARPEDLAAAAASLESLKLKR